MRKSTRLSNSEGSLPRLGRYRLEPELTGFLEDVFQRVPTPQTPFLLEFSKDLCWLNGNLSLLDALPTAVD